MAERSKAPADVIEIRKAFDVACQCVLLSLLDLKPSSAKARLGETTNPIIWQVGHLANHQDQALHRTNSGAGVLDASIGRYFSWGTNPSDDLPHYPPLADVVDAFIAATRSTAKLLDATTEAQWRSPRTTSDGRAVAGGETTAEIVRRMTLHYMFHVGCIAAIRKELGDKCPCGFVPGMSSEAMAKQQARWDAFWQAHRADYL